MATRADSHKQERIGKAAELVRTKIAGDKADNAELFVREFYAGVLEDDIQGVEPMTSNVSQPLRLRDDVVTDGGNVEAVLSNAPKAADGFYVVPKVVE